MSVPRYDSYSDGELREELRRLDSIEDISMTEWEKNFIENVCFQYTTGKFSPKQRKAAKAILEKYDKE